MSPAAVTEVVSWVIAPTAPSNHRYAELGEPVDQRLLQRRTANAQARAGPEASVNLMPVVEITDAVERSP